MPGPFGSDCFLVFACIIPAVALGAVMDELTDGWLGVSDDARHQEAGASGTLGREVESIRVVLDQPRQKLLALALGIVALVVELLVSVRQCGEVRCQRRRKRTRCEGSERARSVVGD